MQAVAQSERNGLREKADKTKTDTKVNRMETEKEKTTGESKKEK